MYVIVVSQAVPDITIRESGHLAEQTRKMQVNKRQNTCQLAIRFSIQVIAPVPIGSFYGKFPGKKVVWR